MCGGSLKDFVFCTILTYNRLRGHARSTSALSALDVETSKPFRQGLELGRSVDDEGSECLDRSGWSAFVCGRTSKHRKSKFECFVLHRKPKHTHTRIYKWPLNILNATISEWRPGSSRAATSAPNWRRRRLEDSFKKLTWDFNILL